MKTVGSTVTLTVMTDPIDNQQADSSCKLVVSAKQAPRRRKMVDWRQQANSFRPSQIQRQSAPFRQ